MAILSGNILISSLSLFHLTLAYFLHTSPTTVTKHGTVLVLSHAFALPISPSFLAGQSGALTLLACVLALLGVTDLFSAGLPEEIGMLYWGSQAPVRCAFFFLLTTWSWLGGPKGMASISGATAGKPPGYVPPGFVYGPFSDGAVFAWAFLETLMWFWIFITLRDERREMMMKRAERAQRE